MGDRFPRRLWIIKAPMTLSYQVCKDDEELSTPYMSVAEHEARVKDLDRENKALVASNGQSGELIMELQNETAALRKVVNLARAKLNTEYPCSELQNLIRKLDGAPEFEHEVVAGKCRFCGVAVDTSGKKSSQ